MRAMSKREIAEFYRRLAETRPIPQTELEFINPFTLLAAVVLSAQATDAGVNKATPALFALADTPQKMLALGEERVTGLIRTIGLFRTKAKNLIALSRILVERHAGCGAAPARGARSAARGRAQDRERGHERRLWRADHRGRHPHLPGRQPHRPRAGKTPLAVELALEKRTPTQYKAYAHHWLILHGRYVCKARKPECPACVVAELCHYGAKTGPAELIAARASAAEAAALTDPPVTDPPPPAARGGLSPRRAPAARRR